MAGKRIGILTFHRSINYGAFMQCFSLATRLRKELPACEVEVIDYESRVVHDAYRPRLSPGCIKHPTRYPGQLRRYRKFRAAWKTLPLSDRYFIFDREDDEFFRYVSERYDGVIVGSDAVWNWLWRGFPNPYLLGFSEKFKKYSYAASAYGMGLSHVGEREKEYFSKALAGYRFIGVRDEYTANLVQMLRPEQKAVYTCDPTVFLDMDAVYAMLEESRESFAGKLRQKYHIPLNKKIICVMDTQRDIIRSIRQRYGGECFIISLYNLLPGADRCMIDLGPFEWAVIFTLCDVTVTSYFHGMLLSLRNNTPVISIDRTQFSKDYEGKIHDVMRRLGILEFFFSDSDPCEEVLAKMDELLKNGEGYREKTAGALGRLSQSSDVFFETLRNEF